MRKHTFHIHIEGRVQGVGFRPHVYRIAQQFQLNGWVCNDVDGVHIEINAEEEEAKRFCHEVIAQAPSISTIVRHSLREVSFNDYQNFFIKESSSSAKPNLLLTPDLAICEYCRAEIHSSSSRRFQYPFTTCTQCGPRYSIITDLPYDRERTTMQEFAMCARCNAEYHDIDDRRYYSQTNSCPECAVHLWLTDNTGRRITDAPRQCILQAAEFIREGKIIAVKGIGGFLLMCDARSEIGVTLLRKRKLRPSKPFALMYPSLKKLQEDCFVSEEEATAFTSIEGPIVLLQMKTERKNKIAFDAIAPDLSRIGVMNPYSPLFELLMNELNFPVVATSGNISGSPIFYENEKAFENLKHLADYFLMNDRDIVLPQDDSVIQFTSFAKQKIILRRSRGLAPSFLHHSWKNFDEEIFCAGADLKSAFTLQHANNTYTSQFLGDLENFDSQLSYRKVLNHLLQMLKMKPSVVIHDLHPQYFSSMIAEDFAKENQLPVFIVQHHEAHFAAVLGENELLNSKEKVLGVIWDGVGFDADGSIRGGEIFLFENGKINRVASLESFPYLLGDKMSKEPRLSALSLAVKFPEAEKILRPQFSEQEWNFLQKVFRQENHPASTSMGRLFDAVASLLGITSFNTFEGEAAMYLENLAASSSKQDWNPFDIGNSSTATFPTSLIIQQIISEINRSTAREIIALRFHQTLVSWIEHAAKSFPVKHLAFSGGVFQNALLVDLIINRLKKNFTLHFHKQLSPNDECISFGQLAAFYLKRKSN